MPIINQIVKGGGSPAPAQIPNYYPKLTVNQNGELVHDYSQTVFSTAPATDIVDVGLYYGAFTNFNDPNSPYYNLQTVNLDSLEHISSGDECFAQAFQSVRTITSFSAANLIDINAGGVFTNAFSNVDNGASANYVTTFSFPALVDLFGTAIFQEAWYNNMRITTLSFPLLETVGGDCFAYACNSSPLVSSASFPSLIGVSNGDFAYAFANISPSTYDLPTHTLTLTFGGTDPIDFGGNVDCFDNMLDGTDIDVTINAPLASQSDFEQMTGYPDFGCTGTVTWNWQS